MNDVNDNSLNEVLRLEEVRKNRGYKAGWLFYRCKDKGLLEAYESLKKQGRISIDHSESIKSATNEDKQTLTVEMVPETCWFSNVRSNVSKDDWEKLRKETARAAKQKCEICSGQGSKWPVECLSWQKINNDFLR